MVGEEGGEKREEKGEGEEERGGEEQEGEKGERRREGGRRVEGGREEVLRRVFSHFMALTCKKGEGEERRRKNSSRATLEKRE